jgi:hypothetical protein
MARHDRLARSGLAHDAEGLADSDRHRDRVDRLYNSVVRLELTLRSISSRRGPQPSMPRLRIKSVTNPSPKKFTQITTTNNIKPGKYNR